MLRRVLVTAGTVITTAVLMVLLWHEPSKVSAQSTGSATNPSCSISSMSLSGNTGFQGTGGAPVGVWSPNFVCVADLDGSGTKQVIVGYQKSTAGTVNYGPPPAYEVTIINNNGTVRATVPFPQ
jgi:hypothetical protein